MLKPTHGKVTLKAVLLACVALPGTALAASPTSVHSTPLPQAVAQIIPQGDLTLFASTVNQHTVVIPVEAADWRQSLSATLEQVGLTFSDQGQLVRIGTIADIQSINQTAYNLAPGIPAVSVTTLYQGQHVNTPGFSLTSQPVGVAPQATSGVALEAKQTTTWTQPINLMQATATPIIREHIVPAVAGAASPGAPQALMNEGVPHSGQGENVHQAPPPPPALLSWSLTPGTFTSKDMQTWANQAGWQIKWEYPNEHSPEDIVVAAPATFQGQFLDVAKQVIKALREQQMQAGTPSNLAIHYDSYPDNRVLIVDTSTSEGASNADQ